METLIPYVVPIGCFVLGGICHGALHRIGAKIVDKLTAEAKRKPKR